MWNLIAIGLVFVVMAVGAVYAFGGFNSTSQQQNGQNLEQETSQLIAAINTAYGSVPDFSALTASSAEINQYAPSTWQFASGGTNFILPEGGTATLAPASVNGGTNNGYTLTLGALNPSECSTMGDFAISQLSSITVNSATASNPAYGGSSTTWPQNLSANCTAGSTNTVALTVVGQ
jgi:hypothetical protein